MSHFAIHGELIVLDHCGDKPVCVGNFDTVSKLPDGVSRMERFPNLISDQGLQVMAVLFAGGFGVGALVGANAYSYETVVDPAVGFTGAFVGEMQIGDAPIPAAPDPLLTSLTDGPVFVARVDQPSLLAPTLTSTHPSNGVVDFVCTIPPGVLDGVTFTEEALFTFDGNLVARRLIDPGWPKPAGQSTQFVHRFTFARV